MEIGIGLPNTVLEVPGRLMVDWARRAEERGFSSLAAIDRLAYPTYDSLTALTAAAAVTERIGLVTNVLLEPLYPPVPLAKVTASSTSCRPAASPSGSGSAAARTTTSWPAARSATAAAGSTPTWRALHQAWAGRPVAGSRFPPGPPTTRGRDPLLIGGQAKLAAPRAARWGAGFTIGGAPPEMAAGPHPGVHRRLGGGRRDRQAAGRGPVLLLPG